MKGPQLSLLYNTMVLPHLQYCLINWGNFQGDRNMGLRDGLLTLQKSLVRIISNVSRITHADPLFASLGILKIDDLFTQAVRIFSYKLSNNLLPVEMTRYFTKVRHDHNTRGARSNFFASHSNSRSIKYIAPKIWNALSLDLKRSSSIASFKTGSKAALLGPYSGFVCNVRRCRSCLAAVARPPA